MEFYVYWTQWTLNQYVWTSFSWYRPRKLWKPWEAIFPSLVGSQMHRLHGFSRHSLPLHLAFAILPMITSGCHLRIEPRRREETPPHERLLEHCQTLEDEPNIILYCKSYSPYNSRFLTAISMPKIGEPVLEGLIRKALNERIGPSFTEQGKTQLFSGKFLELHIKRLLFPVQKRPYLVMNFFFLFSLILMF